MDQFLEKRKLPQLTPNEKIICIALTIKDIELIVNNLRPLEKELSKPRWFYSRIDIQV